MLQRVAAAVRGAPAAVLMLRPWQAQQRCGSAAAPVTVTTTSGDWDPELYRRFQSERDQPFFDLMALLKQPSAPQNADITVIDLGCGTGHLTAQLHRHLGARLTVGVDSSTAMLEQAKPYASESLRFEFGDISQMDLCAVAARHCRSAGGAFERPVPESAEAVASAAFTVVFSNAALQWVDDHHTLIPRLLRSLPAGGQLAFQVPANHDHPTHRIARELAAQSAFRDRLQGFARHSPVLAPEEYAALLAREGVREMHVRLQVYCHWLADWRAAVDWVSGTLLTAYRARLDPASYRAFLAEYQRRVQAALGDAQPLFYPFKRILVWARRESGPRA